MELLTPLTLSIGVIALSVGWIATTLIRVRHGYPLENSWGKAVYPKSDEAK